LSLFKKAEPKSKRIKMLIYGPSGIGKTTFALNFPSPGVIDGERGTDFYGSKFNFMRIQTGDHIVVSQAIDELLQDPGDLKTFVIDPYTKIDESIVLGHLKRMRIKNNNPNYSLQPLDFKAIKEERKLFINKLLSLDMNIIITAPDKKEYSTADGEFMKVIGTGPDVPKEIPFMFDINLQAYIGEDGVTRMLRVDKDRSMLLPETFEMSYDTLVNIIGIEGLEREASQAKQLSTINEVAGRNIKITLNGEEIMTAGISADQLKQIQLLISPENEEKVQQTLLDDYAVNSFLDLRKDEAALFIDTLENQI
jgi:hypothetical protein